MKWRDRLVEVRRYPSAVVGLALIAVLVGISIYTVIAIPYGEAIRLWRGGEETWIENPRYARPAWFNLLPGVNLPETIVLQSGVAGNKTVTSDEGIGEVVISLPFEFAYDAFPQDLSVFFTAAYTERKPHVVMTWVTPDGRRIPLGRRGVGAKDRYLPAGDAALVRRLGGKLPEVGLFSAPSAAAETKPIPMKGRYELLVEGTLFEPDSDLDVKLVVYGRVHGLAGTDHLRRDLMVALLWGTPIALLFGLLAAVGVTLSQFVIAATGAWFGGKVDSLIQRITEVKMILPVLPILIMIGMWNRSIWVILGAVIVLNVVGGGVKTYRAMFLQAKEAPYIEAAKAYGARNARIVFRYLIPRVIPVLIPSFVMVIPSYVFLEASLAFLGLGDPVLPTWGKVLFESNIGALLQRHYYWVLQPAILLMVTGFAFALVGFALDRIFNPRLRTL